MLGARHHLPTPHRRMNPRGVDARVWIADRGPGLFWLVSPGWQQILAQRLHIVSIRITLRIWQKTYWCAMFRIACTPP